MEEKDKIIVKWAQEDVGMSNNLLNNNNMFISLMMARYETKRVKAWQCKY